MSKKESVLKVLEKKIKVKVPKKYSPEEFFKDRKGLFVFSSFQDLILSKAEETKKVEFEIYSYDLVKSSYDEDIEKALPKKHIFSETEVCAIVASLIEKQPKGEEGILINTGYANIFYTPSHVVDVYWSVGEWNVDDWRRDDYCSEGLRVFSPATEA